MTRPRPSSAPQEGAERRAWERGPLVFTADMIIRDQVYVSLSQNISGGGMFLRVPGARDIGERLRLRFRLADGREIDVEAEVVWSASRPAGPLGLRQLPVGTGMKFVNLGEAERALVLGYVRMVLRDL